VRLDRFDLNLLIVLDILLEERNVTRASERLHIGQSATSAALGRLRDYFGDSLLVPVGRRMELTPLAQSLTSPVRDTLMRARATISLRPNFDPATMSRDFSIAASDYMVEILVAHAVRSLAKSTPGVRLDLGSLPEDMIETFERGAIDLLLIPEQYASRLQHPQVELLRDEQVCMVCGNSDINELTMKQYLDLGHIAIRLGDESSLAFEEWFLPRFGRQRRIECTVNHFSAAPLLVIGTNRIVTLHRLLAEQMAQRFPVKLLTAPFDMQPVVEVMVWPRYLDEDPAHKWLRSTIQDTARSLRANHSAGYSS
jgi:LysR family transcriptional regulator, nod-box dependent transcriptional activator